MRRNGLITMSLVALILPLSAWAQPGPGGGRFGGPGGPQGRPGGGPPPGGLGEMLDRALDLTDEQRGEVDAILATHETEMNEMRSLFQEMREARRSGDQARFEELRAQMQAQREEHQPLQAVLDEITPILTEEQLVRLERVRERVGQGPGGRRGPAGAPRMPFRELVQRLPQVLELTEDQQTQYDALVERYQEQMGDTEALRETMRPLVEEMREARRSGDTERAEELQQQIREQVGDRERLGPQFMEELETLLTAEQIEALHAFMAEMGGRRGPGGAAGDPRTMLRVLRRLDLTADQQQQVREIIEASREQMREIERQDRDARMALAEQVKEDIKAILTPEQAARMETLLEEQGPRQRGPRGGAGEFGPRPGREGRGGGQQRLGR